MTPACCCWPCCWMRCPRLMKTSAVWGHVGCLPSVSLSSVAAPAPLLASITVIQIRNLTEQTIKGCSSALGTTQSCLRRCGLTQCAYTLTPQTHQWMAFLRSVFAEARAIKAQHTATSRKDHCHATSLWTWRIFFFQMDTNFCTVSLQRLKKAQTVVFLSQSGHMTHSSHTFTGQM